MTTTAAPHRTAGLLLAMALAGLLSVAGCSSGGASSGSTADTATRTAPREQVRGLAPPADAKTSGAKTSGDKQAPAKLVTAARSIVYRGELTVRVGDIKRAAADAAAMAARLGGYVAGDTRASSGDDATADLQLRVPGKSFLDAVGEAAKLGTELKRQFSTEDVTEAVVDVDARIVSQQASIDRVQKFLSRTENVTELAAVERELASRESELASLQAQQRSLAGRVEFSTVTVHLVGRTVTVADDNPTFLSALGSGWHALLSVGNGVLVALGAALPFLVALGVPLGVGFWLLRRRRRAAAPAPAE